MGTPLKVLLVEEAAEDSTLLIRELRRGGYDPSYDRVDSPDSLDLAFSRQTWDLVLMDFTTPGFGGKQALKVVKEHDADIPCIYVSGTVGEDTAVMAMKAGADDYIMKGNLKRLLPAVDRELREAGKRREHRRIEDELRLLQTITVAVTEAADVQSALEVALQMVGAVTGCAAARAWVPSSGGNCLECVATWAGADSELAPFHADSVALELGAGMGLPGRVWAARQALWMSELQADEPLDRSDLLPLAEFNAALCVPVLAENEVVAVLELFLRQMGRHEEDLPRLLSAVATQLGSVIRRKRAEARLTYLANYDPLTGLPNRLLFNDRLHQALIDARRRGRLVGVAFLDLDRFKTINDTLGHAVGDLLLQGAAQRLRACVRDGDTVARLSGDEFTVILADMAKVEDAAHLAQKILDGFAAPFQLSGRELFASPSLGIALFPIDDVTAEGLLRNADSAMYRVKQAGGNDYQFYRRETTYKAAERLALESGLRHAIEREELLLHYQPKVDLLGGEITGVEALVRWQRPHTKLIAPMQFVPLAEEIGLIVPIGEWVLQAACEQMKRWQDANLPRLRLAVNLSARQLRQPDLADTIARMLGQTGLQAAWLELEITESLLLQSDRQAVSLLHDLAALGVHLVLDDFGTGYASLTYLKRFPFQALKIDQSFIRDIPADAANAAIARAVIVLAHDLGMKVVAEGVETYEQLEFLRENECDEVQGFLLGQPFAADEATEMLRSIPAALMRDLPRGRLRA